MSRTDKDQPDWVRGHQAPAHLRSAQHHWNCDSDPEGALRHWRPSDGSHPCDLDDPHTHGWRTACSYWPEDRRGYYRASNYKVRINLGYYSPERAHVRDHLLGVLKSVRTHGAASLAASLDDLDCAAADDWADDWEPISRQGRRSPWYGGYWD